MKKIFHKRSGFTWALIIIPVLLLIFTNTVSAQQPTTNGQPTNPIENGQPTSPTSNSSGNGVLQINPPSISGHQLPGNAFCLLSSVINFLTIYVMPVVIALVVLWSAYLFLTAGGDPKKIATAKQALFWAIIGAVVIIIGQGIILVVRDFFGLPASGNPSC